MKQMIEKSRNMHQGRIVTLMAVALVLACVAALAAATPAFAQTIQKQWTVEFTGTQMKDDGSADITKTISGLQPGDSAEFDVDLFESYEGSADWYMSNEVLKSMEKSFTDANSNSGGSYSYSLVYVDPQGGRKVILANDTVSGDAGTGDTQGLFDATTATGEWFYLDTLNSQEKARVILTVAIDGETHGNPYFDTSARVQLAFAAEPAKENPREPNRPVVSTDPETPEADTPAEDAPKKDLSQTGDDLRLGMLVVVAVLAAAVVIAVAVHNRRTSENTKEGEAR